MYFSNKWEPSHQCLPQCTGKFQVVKPSSVCLSTSPLPGNFMANRANTDQILTAFIKKNVKFMNRDGMNIFWSISYLDYMNTKKYF